MYINYDRLQNIVLQSVENLRKFMQRTQIYFPKELHEDLKIGAKARGVSMAEYIRKLVKDGLYDKLPARSSRKGAKGALVIAENAVSFGIKDMARNFDKYFEESLK